MGNITLCEDISRVDFDDWAIKKIQAYDKPAAQLNFIDVRHAYAVIELVNPTSRRKGCCQRLVDFWLDCCLLKCLGGCLSCLTCTCCCTCCHKLSPLDQALCSPSICLILQLTGSATKGAFLSQDYIELDEDRRLKMTEQSITNRQLVVRKMVNFSDCQNKPQLITEYEFQKPVSYGVVRRAVAGKFVNTKYDIKTNNCFHFVLVAFEALGLDTTILRQRLEVVQGNVRKHDILVPKLEKLLSDN